MGECTSPVPVKITYKIARRLSQGQDGLFFVRIIQNGDDQQSDAHDETQFFICTHNYHPFRKNLETGGSTSPATRLRILYFQGMPFSLGKYGSWFLAVLAILPRRLEDPQGRRRVGKYKKAGGQHHHGHHRPERPFIVRTGAGLAVCGTESSQHADEEGEKIQDERVKAQNASVDVKNSGDRKGSGQGAGEHG